MDDQIAIFDLHDPLQKGFVVEWFKQFGEPCPCPDYKNLDTSRYFIRESIGGLGERYWANTLYEVRECVDFFIAVQAQENPSENFVITADDAVHQALDEMQKRVFH